MDKPDVDTTTVRKEEYFLIGVVVVVVVVLVVVVVVMVAITGRKQRQDGCVLMLQRACMTSKLHPLNIPKDS
ncbi:hypothetical protein ElyMa_001887400 [Elysia marginata]|uniref:Uncharacterized protein n=1 Tax=Elysia marginata TaxID=1093978 RepID=A0AAV4EQK2_9GAST|nr:hypothetical protein ElyMa_001887400 [Elysia marginata]